MPFPKQEPRAFTRQNIEVLKPNQMGVYGLFNPGQWIYVGSGDIRERLLAHFDGDNPRITASNPTLWVDEINANYIQREKELILECRPVCNQRLG